MDSLVRWVIRGCYVDSKPRHKVLAECPTHGSMRSIPLPSPGSLRSRFPCFAGTMRMCDSLGPSHRASFSFAWRYPALRPVLRSQRSRTPDRGPGVHQPVPIAGNGRRETIRVSQRFWGILVCLCPALRPRRDQRIRPYDTSARPPSLRQRRLPTTRLFRGSITRPWHWLSTLRPRGYPRRTQDSLPAAGPALRDGIGYPQDSNGRFRLNVILLPQTS
jgi:hypothetical protein